MRGGGSMAPGLGFVSVRCHGEPSMQGRGRRRGTLGRRHSAERLAGSVHSERVHTERGRDGIGRAVGEKIRP